MNTKKDKVSFILDKIKNIILENMDENSDVSIEETIEMGTANIDGNISVPYRTGWVIVRIKYFDPELKDYR